MNRRLLIALGLQFGLGMPSAFADQEPVSPDDPAAGVGSDDCPPGNVNCHQTTVEPEAAPEEFPAGGRNVSCRKARRIVRGQGFHDIVTVDCTGRYFDFTAWRLESFYKIRVRRWDGRIVIAEPQRLMPLRDQ